MKIKGLSHITLGVKDLEKSRAFYSALFSVNPKYEEPGKDCHFIVEDLWFVLVQDNEVKPSSGYSHIAFAVQPENFPGIAKFINNNNATIWQENQSHGQSLYFKDPDGHKLEVHASNWQSRFQSKQ